MPNQALKDVIAVATHLYTSRMKQETPRFDGINPHGWIFKIEEYFKFYGTEEQNQMKIITLHMGGDALVWYRWIKDNEMFTLWIDFQNKVKRHFGPSKFEDHQRVCLS